MAETFLPAFPLTPSVPKSFKIIPLKNYFSILTETSLIYTHMNKILYAFILLSLYACTPTNTYSPMLWEITNTKLKKSSYLFGTFHTKDPSLNQLNPEVYTSLKKVQRLYTEFAMTPQNMQKIISFSKLKRAIALKKRLHSHTLKKIIHFLKKNRSKLTLKSLAKYKTWAIAIILSNQSVRNNTPFMDENLVSYAKKKKIKTSGLESPKEQLAYFDTLSASLQEQLLLDTLKKETNQNYKNALITWYKKGKADGFLKLQKRFVSHNIKQKKLDKILIDTLLIKRNIRFARRIDILLKNHSKYTYFFAIGAGHMSGKQGIIQKLKDLGYSVKKVD